MEEEVDEEMDEEVDEEHLQVAVDRKASCGTWCFPAHRDSLKEEKSGWRRNKNEDPLQVTVDRKASCNTWCFPAQRDSSGMYYNKLAVKDPIQKYNYRPVMSHLYVV